LKRRWSNEKGAIGKTEGDTRLVRLKTRKEVPAEKGTRKQIAKPKKRGLRKKMKMEGSEISLRGAEKKNRGKKQGVRVVTRQR